MLVPQIKTSDLIPRRTKKKKPSIHTIIFQIKADTMRSTSINLTIIQIIKLNNFITKATPISPSFTTKTQL